jgi:hypothetical protein
MPGGFPGAAFDLTADSRGRTLCQRHRQLHMDFGPTVLPDGSGT